MPSVVLLLPLHWTNCSRRFCTSSLSLWMFFSWDKIICNWMERSSVRSTERKYPEQSLLVRSFKILIHDRTSHYILIQLFSPFKRNRYFVQISNNLIHNRTNHQIITKQDNWKLHSTNNQHYIAVFLRKQHGNIVTLSNPLKSQLSTNQHSMGSGTSSKGKFEL